MTDEELKKKCTERAKIFQQAMESCHSSSLIDCIEWFADRIIELEAQIEKMKCCEMCKHKNLNWGFSPICEARDNIKIENPLTCKCDKWEIKEK